MRVFHAWLYMESGEMMTSCIITRYESHDSIGAPSLVNFLRSPSLGRISKNRVRLRGMSQETVEEAKFIQTEVYEKGLIINGMARFQKYRKILQIKKLHNTKRIQLSFIPNSSTDDRYTILFNYIM